MTPEMSRHDYCYFSNCVARCGYDCRDYGSTWVAYQYRQYGSGWPAHWGNNVLVAVCKYSDQRGDVHPECSMTPNAVGYELWWIDSHDIVTNVLLLPKLLTRCCCCPCWVGSMLRHLSLTRYVVLQFARNFLQVWETIVFQSEYCTL
jgi:hypothetical protein